jgi:hypothetical protein
VFFQYTLLVRESSTEQSNRSDPTQPNPHSFTGSNWIPESHYECESDHRLGRKKKDSESDRVGSSLFFQSNRIIQSFQVESDQIVSNEEL